MNLAAVSTVIYQRCLADSGTGGLTQVCNGVFNSQAPKDTAYPYIVFNVSGGPQNDAFDKDVVEVVIDFHIYGSTSSGLSAVTNVLDRIYGDAVTHGDRTPTYGFHRWKPTLSGGWTADYFLRSGQFSQSDTLDAYHYIDSYTILISR